MQKYPDLRESPGGAPEQPYDAAGWTLPLSMGVEMQTIGHLDDEKRAELHKALKPLGQVPSPTARPTMYDSIGGTDPSPFDSAPGLGFDTYPLAAAIVPPTGAITGSGPSLSIDPGQNNAFRALNQAWKAGATVAWAPGTPGQSGRYVISGLSPDAQQTMVRTLALRAEAVAAPATNLKQPRIAMFQPPGSMDEGWTRWVLERFEFPFTSLSADDIAGGKLGDRFDAIVITDEPRGVLAGGGRGGRGGGGAGRPGGAGRAAGGGEAGGGGAPAMPAPDAARVEAIDEFVRAGGTLVCLNRSTAFAIEQLKLPVRNTLQGLGRQEFFAGGSLMNVLVDPSKPVMAGLAPTTAVFFNSSPAFETLVGFTGTVLARYADTGSPLASGYLLGEQHLQGKSAALEVQHGDGRVILFGFRPQWRGQTFGTFKVIFNAIIGAR